MRARVLLLLLALAAGAAAGLLLHEEGGYVLIRAQGWVLETSLLGFVLGFVGVALLFWMSVRLLVATLRLPARVRESLDRRRQERAQASFESGLQKLLEGHWRRAEIELVRRAADHHRSDLNYLLAARAAHEQRALQRRDHYLGLAARAGEAAERAAALVGADLRLASGDLAAARTALRRLHEAQPRQPRVIALLAEALAQGGDWAELRRLLQGAPRETGLATERRRELLHRSLLELMLEAVREARLESLKQVWEQASAEERRDVRLRQAYARALARLNAEAEAAAQIAAVLREQWDGELVRLFGDLQAGDPLTQLATIEQWLQEYGEQPELLVVAGQACARNRLWGKARSYLEAALRLRPTAGVYLELARLCEQTQKADEAARFYRQGLEFAAS